MIIYLFNQNYFVKTYLPLIVDGVYPIYLENARFLANIEEKDGKWCIQKNDNIEIFHEEEIAINPVINEYDFYTIKDLSFNVTFNLICTKSFDSNFLKIFTDKDELIIGPGIADIEFDNKHFKTSPIKVKFVKPENRWYLETEDTNTFVMDTRVNKCKIKCGDYLFYYGLKIIFIDKMLIINNPKESIKISNTFKMFKEETIPEIKENKAVDDTPLFSKDDYFLKAPRFVTVMDEEEVKIEEPPTPEQENDTSIILTVGPQLTMMATSVITLFNYITTYLEGGTTLSRFITSATTIAITMTGTVMWPLITKKMNSKNHIKKENKRQKKYIEYLQQKKHEIFMLKSKQRQLLIEKNTSLGDCAKVIENKTKFLWQRNIENDDFLQIRLGEGSVPTSIKVDSPEEKFSVQDRDKLLSLLNNVIDEAKYINKCPLSINLTQKNITAIVGQKDITKKFMDSLFLQIMTFHAFTELKIVVFTNENNRNKWNYLKILPHCWNNQKSVRYFATNIEEMNVISNDLEKIFNDRISNNEESEKIDNGEKETNTEDVYKKFKPYFLIFSDDISSIRNITIIKRLLEYKINVGFSLLILNDRLSTLPNQTTTFINVDEPLSGLVGNELIVDNQLQFAPELNNNIDMYECAKRLANIPIQVEKAKYELPNSLSFLEMYNVGKVEQLNSLERWKTNNPVNSLSVPVGVDQNGELFKMDIHEKAYGPHGLVAGTTGSGKSEWIITYILSLSVNFHPDEVQFVLIDYKGGGLAMSFENSELNIKLPHLAGTVTNLDKSAINRVISSIESELKRRQQIFNAARESLKEGSMNIYKYQNFYRKGLVSEPMSHLLIISDEFAELKSQQPEFMEQLISTSRIGRSLGVHLILATQKPSGVVNDQIWSNSRFKVCLKVQNKSDSQEMLKNPDAAYLKQTGAFYLQVGTDEYYNLGQAAWAGAKYYPSDVVKKKIDQSAQYIDDIGRVINSYDLDVSKKDPKNSKGEELLNVIQYIDNISDKVKVVGRQLWLPNIPAILYINEVKKKFNHIAQKMKFDTVIGEYDEPRKQEQGILKIFLEDGNIGIIGQVGSGKESLISTIVWSSITEHTPQELNYYIIDFGAETMKKFSKFPHIGEVVFQDETDKVAGILELIEEEIEKRKGLFSDYNGSFETYNKLSGKNVPLIVLIINGFDSMSELMPKLVEYLNSLFRDAPKYGIIFIVSATSPTALRQRQLQYFNRTIMLQLQDETMYRTISNCRNGLIPSKLFGRGLCKTNNDDDSYCEFQTALIASDDLVMQYIRNTAEKFVEYYKFKAKQLAKIPDTVGSEELSKYVTTLENVPIGFNFYEKDVAKYNFVQNKINLIITKEITSAVKFLYSLSSILTKVPNTKVRVIDLNEVFKKPILDIKLFNDNFDAVFSAIDNDVSNRKDTQDWGINIIIGISDYKKMLSKAGVSIASEMLNKIISSKKSIFIFVESYDKLKTLRLEPWFSTIDTTNLLWLGTGVSTQSIFSVNELKPEDKKFKFEGLAFEIVDSKYTVIKTAMDGDE